MNGTGPGGKGSSLLTAHPDLSTVAELSRWKRTGRYDEVVRLCPAFEKAFPKHVKSFQFGETAEGRTLWGLVVSNGLFEASKVKAEKRTVVFVQAGIHPGEIDGKDAGFWLLREILEGRVLPAVLERITIVFIPIFNIDGHERVGKWNRPNQLGPEEMGWRATAQNLNLNRDYVKADAPEMVAMLRLLDLWDPALYIDIHVTDGADFEHDVSVLIDPSQTGPEPLKSVAGKFKKELLDRLSAKGHLPLWFYPHFRNPDEPTSGVDVIQFPPRYSNGYWGMRNRLGMLVETHSWKDYPTRVATTVNLLEETFALAARDGKEWAQSFHSVEEKAKSIGGETTTLTYGLTEKTEAYSFRGFAYQRVPSLISGGVRTIYDPKTPQLWKVPLYCEYHSLMTARAPKNGGGYLVEAGFAPWMKEKLKLHCIHYENVAKTTDPTAVETFRAESIHPSPQTFEGRTQIKVTGQWKTERRVIAGGSLFIPIAQPNSRLLMQLLEPQAEDSFLSWGFFNACFEQKEMMENYVAEQIAEEMLKDPQTKQAFEEKIKNEPAFASSPEQRLNFFYRRHPSWDERMNLYPVYKIDSHPQI